MTGNKETPSQTVGPYVHIGMATDVAGLGKVYARPLADAIAGPKAAGTRIRVTGRIFDGLDEPVRDAVLEVWQADARGIYNSPGDPRHAERDPQVCGWGRVSCDLKTGVYAFDTIKPGAVPGPRGSMMAPHLNLWILARGINIGLSTRVYFPEDETARAADPILSRIEHAKRRATLIASADGKEGQVALYRFDIRLQGEDETVFFDA